MVGLDALGWIQVLTLGGLAGALGQLMRVVVGMRKLGQEATARGTSREELISPARIVISIAIGATAGAAAGVVSGMSPASVSGQQFLALVGAGYAGADFIEGAIGKVIPSGGAAGDGGTKPPASAAMTIPSHGELSESTSGAEYLG